MLRLGILFVLVIIISCKRNKKKETDADGFSYEAFSGKFRRTNVPIQISDTSLNRNTDTAVVKPVEISAFIPDSLKAHLFGKGSKVRYLAMYKTEKSNSEIYYLLKAVSYSKKGALLLLFKKDGTFLSTFPLLLQDNDPSTSQVSSVDKS